MIDLKTLTDEEFEDHRACLMAELERRNKLRDAPGQIKALAKEYESLGGDRAVLLDEISKNDEPAAELPATVPDDTIQDESIN